jgi:hypothetical protein
MKRDAIHVRAGVDFKLGIINIVLSLGTNHASPRVNVTHHVSRLHDAIPFVVEV